VAVERLAYHFIAAGAHERGLVCAKEAAAEAARLFAYDEALAAYGLAPSNARRFSTGRVNRRRSKRRWAKRASTAAA